jgi:hypothetical protein
MVSTNKPGPEALALIVATLTANPESTYADVKDKAEKKGFTIFPVMYGRAKALLGLVKVSPRGEGRFAMAKKAPALKAAAKAAAKVAAAASSAVKAPKAQKTQKAAKVAKAPVTAPIVTGKRGPGRPPKVAAAASFAGGLEGVLAVVKQNEQERVRLRGTLERLHSMISDALGG